MSKDAFDKIKAGLEDALAYAKGDTSRGEIHNGSEAISVDTQRSSGQQKPAATKKRGGLQQSS